MKIFGSDYAHGSIDFHSGRVGEGEDTSDATGEKLLQKVADTAPGTMTKVETIRHTDPTRYISGIRAFRQAF